MRWRGNVKPKHSRDAPNGWYRYETQFAVPVLNAKKAIDHYTVYGGTLLIRNDADGRSYLYDLLDVQKKKVISAASFSAKTHSEVFAPKPSANSIPASGGNVNTNNLSDIPSFVWDFSFQPSFRPSDFSQLLCGISVFTPNFG